MLCPEACSASSPTWASPGDRHDRPSPGSGGPTSPRAMPMAACGRRCGGGGKMAPGLIQVSGDTLSLAEGVRVDVRELAVWAERVSDPRMPIEEISASDVRLSGELFPGWDDDWVLLDRERLRQLRMHALEALADRLAMAHRYGEAVQAAYWAVRAE